MKLKKLLLLIPILLICLGLTACGDNKKNTLTVGASPMPHSEILQHIKPELKKEGINLKIVTFQDYMLPNKSLKNGDIDANYFQHDPFLQEWNQKNHSNLINDGAIHLEPLAIYSKKYASLEKLPNHATILVSNSVSDYGRVLQILKSHHLITLNKGVDIKKATFKDVKTNKKHLKFKTGYEPKLMPQLFNNKQGDAVVINSNYAVQAHLNPARDAIAEEGSNSPYSNIIAIRPSEKNNWKIKKLIKVLKSKKTQEWIKNRYKGSVLPAN